MNRNEIIAAIPKLSPADLAAVTKAIKAQAQDGYNPTSVNKVGCPRGFLIGRPQLFGQGH